MTNPQDHQGRPDFVDTSDSSQVRSSHGGDSATPQGPEGSRRGEPAGWGTSSPVDAGDAAASSPVPSPRRGDSAAPAEHPKSLTVLVLGILGFLLWIPGMIGWVMGGKAKKEIQRDGAPYPWDGALRAGYTLSVLSTVVVGLYVLMMLLLVLMIAAIVSQ